MIDRNDDAPTIVDARLRAAGRRLSLSFGNGASATLLVADLPFSPGPQADRVRVIAAGDAVEIETLSGDFVVLADELARLAASQPLGNEDMARTIGSNVRRIREERGLLLRDLEALTGIAVPNLSALQAGRGIPRLDTLDRVARALGVSIADLVSDRPADGAVATSHAAGGSVLVEIPGPVAALAAVAAAAEGLATYDWVIRVLTDVLSGPAAGAWLTTNFVAQTLLTLTTEHVGAFGGVTAGGGVTTAQTPSSPHHAWLLAGSAMRGRA